MGDLEPTEFAQALVNLTVEMLPPHQRSGIDALLVCCAMAGYQIELIRSHIGTKCLSLESTRDPWAMFKRTVG